MLIKRTTLDPALLTHSDVHTHCACGAALFTCHDDTGVLIWRGWNHNVGMRKIAARKQRPDYDALEVSAGA